MSGEQRATRRDGLLAAAAALTVGGGVVEAHAQPPPAPLPPPSGHPAEDYRRAADLFRAGRREEATELFYRGQLRARVHLAARPDLPPSGDPALFASLNESLGRPINEWAAGDLPMLVAALDRVLAWHAANDDPHTPKASFPEAHASVRAGLERLRAYFADNADDIRAQRRANGLPNRNPPDPPR